MLPGKNPLKDAHAALDAAVLAAYERSEGHLVPRRATLHDVGSALTHERIICHKRYAEGKEPHEVARETWHSLEAVDRYLGQYDRQAWETAGERRCSKASE